MKVYKRIIASVRGRVQGVGFRYYIMNVARNLLIAGYVQNVRGGTVEVVAEGGETELKSLIEVLRIGPATSRVDDCYVQWLPFENTFNDFQMRVK
jgi:acylphosphatase